MASVAYSRTNGQVSISSQHTKGIPVGLVFFGNIISIPSDVDRLAKDTKCQTSHALTSSSLQRTLTDGE